MKQLPNILSLSRIVIAPVFFFLLISDNANAQCLSLPVFFIGAITDYFDGWLARRMKAVTKFGKFFDPLADKFLTGFAFLGFVVLSIIPLWMVLIVIFRDVLTTVMRFYPLPGYQPIETSGLAKYKTFAQMFFISLLVIIIFMIKCGFTFIQIESLISFLYSDVIYYSMMIIVIMSLWSLVEYSRSLKISQ